MKITEFKVADKFNMKIAVLADTHDMPADKVLRLLEGAHPDVICHVGDIVHHKPLDKSINAQKLLSGCVKIAPTLASVGNHDDDYMESGDIEKIKAMGVKVLTNEYALIGGVLFGGFPSLMHRDRAMTHDTINWLNGFGKLKGYKILLCHHPEYYDRYDVGKNVDLVLSGHVHGGQMRFFGRGLFSDGQGFLPKYSKGMYNGNMIVSGGLANTGGIFLPRVFNEAEIVVVKI